MPWREEIEVERKRERGITSGGEKERERGKTKAVERREGGKKMKMIHRIKIEILLIIQNRRTSANV